MAAVRGHQTTDLTDPADAGRPQRPFSFGDTNLLPNDEWEAKH